MRKYFSTFILIIIMIVSLCITNINVNADSNIGSLPPAGSGGSSSGGTGGCALNLISFGYRISLVNGTKDYSQVSNTKSIDYWNKYQKSDNEYGTKCYRGLGGYTIMSYDYNLYMEPIYYSSNLCTKQEVAKGNSCGFSEHKTKYSSTCPAGTYSRYPIGGSSNAKLDILGLSTADFAGTTKYGDSPGATKSGNYFAKDAMDALEKLLTTDSNGNLSATQKQTLEQILTNSGYTKGLDAAISEGIVIQVEPLASLRFNPGSSCGGTAARIYAGSMAELYNGPIKTANISNWALYHTTYGHQIIYAGASKTHGENSVFTGITIGNPGVVQDNIKTKGTNTSSFGLALFYLPDYIKNDSCSNDLQEALKLTSASAYKTAIENIKTQPYYKDSCGTDGSKCPFLKYSFSEVSYAGYLNSTSASCSTKITCPQMAKAIYNKKNSGINLTNYAGTVTATNYEDAIKNFAFPLDSGTKDYNNNQWNEIYLNMQRKIKPGFFPTSCSAVTCDNDNVKEIYDNYFGTQEYENYMNWLYQATGNKFQLLLTTIWQQLDNGNTNGKGPSCIQPPNDCDAPSFSYSCGDKIILQDYQYGSNSASARKCWQSGYAYTNSGVMVSSFHKRVSKKCLLYCSEKVEFDLPSAVNSDVKAGTVFKWGTNLDKSSTLFATMKVSLSCKAVPDPDWYEYTGVEPNRKRITPNCTNDDVIYGVNDLKSKISTEINVTYKEPNSTRNGLFDNVKDRMVANYVSGTGGVNETCSNKNCTNIGIFEIVANYEFEYSDNLKWYSKKEDSSLVPNDNAHHNDISSNGSYYYEIGYGLPTTFTTPNGIYGNGGDGKLNANISKIGTRNHFNKLVILYSGKDNIDYSCQFKIKNQLFGEECEYDASGNLKPNAPNYCDPKIDNKVEISTPETSSVKKVDVVFRVVKLINSEANIGIAFPGRTGSGTRDRGTNWRILSNTDIVKVLNSDIYTKDPMFEITLNSANIKDIRNWNKKAKRKGKDPYSEFTPLTAGASSTETNGFTGYKCYERNGNKYCASSFLSQLNTYSDKQKLRGTCMTSSDTMTRAKNNINGC